MAAGNTTAFASLSMLLPLLFMALPIAIGLICGLCHGSRKYQQPLACLAVLWRPQLWNESWDTRYICLVSLMCPLGSVSCQLLVLHDLLWAQVVQYLPRMQKACMTRMTVVVIAFGGI